MTGRPEWLRQLVEAARTVDAGALSRFTPPGDGGRPAAVLILFGDGPAGPDVLLVQRSDGLRSHAGQPAFPGGGEEPGDGGPAGPAPREAEEETGLEPSGVDVLATLPALYLPVSDFVVTPVLAWWREPSAVHAVDPAETAAVARVPVAH